MIACLLRMTLLLLTLAFVGACGGEGGSEGSEGPHAEGGEGSEGPESGATGTGNPFVSTGMSRGSFQSLSLMPDESYAGLLYDTEVAVYFDAVLESFIGRVRNEAPEAVCDVTIVITLDGHRTVNASFSGQPFMLAGLAQLQGTEFEFPAPGASFSSWTVGTETATCSSAPGPVAGGGEGAEGGGGEGSGEHGGSGGGEHGGSGESGAESGDESSPPIPINQPFSGTFGNQRFSFAYDALNGAFRGTVENPTGSFICESRTEIHLGSGGQVLELGPTIPVNLPPGGTQKVVMSADGYVLDMYILHPESTPCP